MRYLLSTLLALWSLPVFAQCPSTPVAVDDQTIAANETVVVDVLANDSNLDGAALTVIRSGNTCGVPASVDADQLLHLEISEGQRLTADCTIFYYTQTEGGEVSSPASVHVDFIEGIFSDGFESGTSERWN